MPLFLLFLLIPIIEIALFIKVGGWLGLWPTLGIVVLTAIIGAFLVRVQGLRALNDLRNSMGHLENPAEPLAHGAMILFSGALLLTPGFFTDAFGFLLLIPGFRLWVMRQLRARVKFETFTYGQPPQTHTPDDIIEGEFEETTQKTNQNNTPSGWTRH